MKLRISFLLSLLLCLVACNDSDNLNCLEVIENTDNSSIPTNLSYIQQSIAFSRPNTRAANSYSIEPYIYKGDTVMYIVNYDEGWELYANDTSVPMVLASSDDGHFSLVDELVPTPYKNYIESLAEGLYLRKENGLSNSTFVEDWLPFSRPDSIQGPIDSIGNYPYPIEDVPIICNYGDVVGPQGAWVPISQTVTKDSIMIPHLLNTHWSQNYPWNTRTVMCRTHNKQCLVGCVAIAIGQELYYLVHEKNMYFPMPDHAVYDPVSNSQTFSGSSMSIWHGMACSATTSTPYTEAAALVLGYIGQQVSMHYGCADCGGSGSFYINYTNYLHSIGLYEYSNYPNPNYIIDHLERNYPVMTIASARNANAGHMFVIDRYKTVNKHVTTTYGWQGIDQYGNLAMKFDNNGRIIFHRYQCTKTDDIVTNTVQMNWGWNSSYYDNTWFNILPEDSWDAGGYEFIAPQIIHDGL